jgi:UDP:flavonoid glycosyltransferase YjiC (YdhE family)
MAGMESAEDILVVDDVPHDWLFPRVAAVVCHGGAGTVAAVLRSGTPAVIVPYIYDQPFWGWALARLGIAPRMIPRRRLSVERLTASLRQAITDDVMRQRAREASECVQAEDGVRRAVEAIDRWLSPTLVGSGAAKRASRAPEPKPV